MVQTTELPKEREIALLREASMSSMAIGIGLTHIRQYDFIHTGFFYSGLLSFTNGIERLAKIIWIYDYRLKNQDAFPTDNKNLRRLCHRLDVLIEKTREIGKSQAVNLDDSFFDKDSLYQKIVTCLADFADKARYYNLDYLAGVEQPSTEPLERWDKEICSEIIKRHYRPNQRRIELKKHFGEELDRFGASVSYIHEDGSEINNAASLFVSGDSIPTKQKYSMYYLYTIARFLSNLCAALEYKGNFYPYLREFFAIFIVEDKKQILGKKTWLPL